MKRSQSCFRTLACSLVIAAVSGSVRARACDTAAKARPDSTCVVLERQGVRGVWFQLATAEELRTSHRLIPELRLQLEKYSEMEMAYASEVRSLREALALREAAGEKLKAQAVQSAKDAQAAQAEAMAAREELDRWWRSPWVWLTVGALAGGLAGLAIAN